MLIFEHLSVNTEKCEKAMTDELFATKKVYDLVETGVPFREAYRKISKN
jgi:argininosuccinate lyase